MRPPHPLILAPLFAALALLGAVAYYIWPRPTVVQSEVRPVQADVWGEIRRAGREMAINNPFDQRPSSVMPNRK